VTTFELFFDLVYVFAATQVTGYMAMAMAAIFVVALTIPEAWQDAPGGLNGPLVLVGAYLVVRCVHLTSMGWQRPVTAACGGSWPSPGGLCSPGRPC
jgi:hypothetical protein